MADKTVTITLTDNSDPNGANNFNYAPGYLQVHRGDRVRFTCNQAFTINFVNGSPFEDTSAVSQDSASTSEYSTISSGAKRKSYHYTVSAINSDGIIQVDGTCPTLVVT